MRDKAMMSLCELAKLTTFQKKPPKHHVRLMRKLEGKNREKRHARKKQAK